MQGFKDDRK